MYAIWQIRNLVFSVEQKITVPDADGRDKTAMHLLLREGDTLIGYARLFAPDASGYVSFGRVCIAASHRRKGLGTQLINELLHYIEVIHPGCPIKIGAQAYLEDLYKKCGFLAPEGAAKYMIGPIPHIDMRHEPFMPPAPMPWFRAAITLDEDLALGRHAR